MKWDPAQAIELIALLKRAFVVLPNLESLDIDGALNPIVGSPGILDTLRLPSLRTFRIDMESDHPDLVDFLSSHPRLKDIELIIDGLEDEELEDELTFPELERFTAPFTYWAALQPNPNLRFAGLHQDRFMVLDHDPFDVIHPLGKFTGLKSVWLLIPAERTLPYLMDLKEELPMLEELSVDFANWNDHGEAVVSHRAPPFCRHQPHQITMYSFHSWYHPPFGTSQSTSLSVAACLTHFKVLNLVSVESDPWNHEVTQTTAMTLAEEASKHCDTLLRARFGQRFRSCRFMNSFFFCD